MNYTEEIRKHLQVELEPSDAAYRCYNTGGVEVETGEFLYSLVRLTKAKRILETGTHKGISAAYMAGALKDNMRDGAKRGIISTIEFLQPNFQEASQLFKNLELGEHVEQLLMDAAKYVPGQEIFDIIFLDTEPQTRFAELEKFYNNLKPGGFLLIHDLHPHMHQIENAEHGFAWPYGAVPTGMKVLMHEDKLRPVWFRTPRGLTMFYKPAADDYKGYK